MSDLLYAKSNDIGAVLVMTANGAGTQTGALLYNPWSAGVRVIVDITAKTGTIDVTCNIYTVDRASGKAILRLASASLTATGTTEYIVHPALTAAANTIAKNFIGEVFRIDLVHGTGSTPSTTGTVGACLLP